MKLTRLKPGTPSTLRPYLWHYFSALMVLFLWVALPSPADAQQLDGEVEALLKKIDNDEANYEKKPVPPSSVDAINLDVHWRLFRSEERRVGKECRSRW